ncbi:MAG: hypothetical protein EOP07_03595 [Proteobacteria bacterium]|nr:MAG: hypothetical protein EOP07_03595 [Pseudomonadota bacterium]
MKKSEEGSATFTALAAVASLFFATMYVQNSSTQLNQTAKKAKIDETLDAARMNNMSNLSMIRSLMNSSKVAATLFEPAVYPSNYFSESWDMKKNDLRPGGNYTASGRTFTVKSFEASSVAIKDAEAYFKGGAPKSQLADLKATKELTILKLNPDPVHKYWIRSVDVQAKNKLSGGGSASLDSIGRIQLAAPEPGPVTLYISLAGSGVWSTNYGTTASPLRY